MLYVALLAIAAPVIAVSGAALLRLGQRAADARGIALQTVIIMVVLVVIAGAVTAVLVTRAGTETDRLEDADSELDPDQYPNKALCEQASTADAPLKWSGGACVVGP